MARGAAAWFKEDASRTTVNPQWCVVGQCLFGARASAMFHA
jgi:hypothetical protein